ncbi:hypothetical protein BV20DRAFT_915497, partial [Pilatotrama ljubarskyi]
SKTCVFFPNKTAPQEQPFTIAFRFAELADFADFVRVIAEAKGHLAAREEDLQRQMRSLHNLHFHPV